MMDILEMEINPETERGVVRAASQADGFVGRYPDFIDFPVSIAIRRVSSAVLFLYKTVFLQEYSYYNLINIRI